MVRVNRETVHPKSLIMNSEPRPTWLIGIDEVGRGPLAGPITVAAVAAIVKNYELGIVNYGLKDIKDSKKLSPSKREQWNNIIKQNLPFAIASVSHSVIDRKGIRHACSLAVKNVLKKLLYRNPIIHNSKFIILLDGNLAAPLEYKNQQTIIKGDEKVPVIAAASIIAKVHRDRYMTRLYKKYPLYGFEKHKGYGTKMHTEAILKNGLSEIHRKSFCKNLHYINKVV